MQYADKVIRNLEIELNPGKCGLFQLIKVPFFKDFYAPFIWREKMNLPLLINYLQLLYLQSFILEYIIKS